jgi:hypothetical protein
MNEPAGLPPVDWEDFSELHKTDDGGGVLSSLKAVRQGTLAQMVHFVASLPEEERREYVIIKSGDHKLTPAEIMMLTRRPDYPG